MQRRRSSAFTGADPNGLGGSGGTCGGRAAMAAPSFAVSALAVGLASCFAARAAPATGSRRRSGESGGGSGSGGEGTATPRMFGSGRIELATKGSGVAGARAEAAAATAKRHSPRGRPSPHRPERDDDDDERSVLSRASSLGTRSLAPSTTSQVAREGNVATLAADLYLGVTRPCAHPAINQSPINLSLSLSLSHSLSLSLNLSTRPLPNI
jgi:hypothetical protein